MTLPLATKMSAEIIGPTLKIVTQGHPRVVIETAFATLSAEDRVACMRTLAHIHINQPTTFVTEMQP